MSKRATTEMLAAVTSRHNDAVRQEQSPETVASLNDIPTLVDLIKSERAKSAAQMKIIDAQATELEGFYKGRNDAAGVLAPAT